MRALVHEHGQPELAAADDHHGQGEHERRRPPRVDSHGGRDHTPGVEDEGEAAPGRGAAEVTELLQGQHIAGRDGGRKGDHGLTAARAI